MMDITSCFVLDSDCFVKYFYSHLVNVCVFACTFVQQSHRSVQLGLTILLER